MTDSHTGYTGPVLSQVEQIERERSRLRELEETRRRDKLQACKTSVSFLPDGRWVLPRHCFEDYEGALRFALERIPD